MTKDLRIFVSRLINLVLVGKINVSAAIKAFPNNYANDETLDAAFHALIHFEADEEAALILDAVQPKASRFGFQQTAHRAEGSTVLFQRS